MTRPSPAEAVASFIDCINRGDLDSLGALMNDDIRLEVLDEEPVCGRAANLDTWAAYLASFPDYLILRRHISTTGPAVGILGTTTGSHLQLPPEQEMKHTIIWAAEVADGRLTLWRVARDTPERRRDLGIPASA